MNGDAVNNKGDVVFLGRVNFRNANRLFGIKRSDRRQHFYMVGKTGTGKTALLHNMVIQDIANGEGLCVVDPHGEFAESLLEKIPQERINDVIYFNPADTDNPIGFNVLELSDPKYKHLVASGLMGIFTKIWANVWSARMEYILNNAVLALLDTPNSTLLGILRLLTDTDYRRKIIANIKDPVVKAFWMNEYEQWREQFRNEAIAPIQNKVGQFLSASIIRNIVGQSRSTIDVFDIINSGKILIINVSKGRIGEDNSALLGAMLITKIQLAAMERVRIPEEERRDFYLYVDEFQNFATESFASILSEARKYRLNLIISHQYIGQLETDVSTKVKDAVFGNVGTMIVFRVGATDAEFLENEFSPELTMQDLVNLPNYQVYLKLMVDGVSSRPFSAITLPPFKVQSSASVKEHIMEASRTNYARSQKQVEDEINRWSAGVGGEEDVSKNEAVCSACGRKIQLPFKPDETRPVYCRDCLVKVRAGGRTGSPKVFVAKPRARYFADLSQLGVELEDKEYQRMASETGDRPSSIIERSEPVQEISLKDLKSRPEKKERELRPKTENEPSLTELQESLKEALKKIV